jgi:hypothetical protein
MRGQCPDAFGGENSQHGYTQTQRQYPQVRRRGQGETDSREQGHVGGEARRAFRHHHEERAWQTPFGGVVETLERSRQSSFVPRGWLPAAAMGVHARVSADPQPQAVEEAASVSGQ